MRAFVLTSLAMCAFAANSLLCRAALDGGAIDAASFTTVRLGAGTVLLAALARFLAPGEIKPRLDWLAACMLFTYAAAFSYAYLSLSAGTGALILFGCVQITMLLDAVRSGERLAPTAWAGFVVAVLGVGYLVSPGVRAPPPIGALLMGCAGIAWGFYSLRGRSTANPLLSTTRNFALTLPFAAALSVLTLKTQQASWPGLALAAASGALTSGLGYVIWYAALRYLSATRAAVVQLSVPAIAAFGGLAFLEEPLTLRLLISSAAVLGGIALVFVQRGPRST